MNTMLWEMVPSELLYLPKVRIKPVKPARPDMPINGLSYADWLAKYRRELTDYFVFLYDRNQATDEEWADYCRAQWIGERELETVQ